MHERRITKYPYLREEPELRASAVSGERQDDKVPVRLWAIRFDLPLFYASGKDAAKTKMA